MVFNHLRFRASVMTSFASFLMTKLLVSLSHIGIRDGGRIQEGRCKDIRQSSRKNTDAGKKPASVPLITWSNEMGSFNTIEPQSNVHKKTPVWKIT